MLLILLFLALVMAGFALITAFDRRNEQARTLRTRLTAIDLAASRAPSADLTILREEVLSTVPVLNRLLSMSINTSRLRLFLMQADVEMLPGKLVLLTACLAAAGLLLGMVVGAPLLFLPLTTVACASLPLVYLSILRRRRFERFEAGFPQAIDLLGRAIRAGHAFSTALELIGKELHEPVAGEFRKLYEEQKFGLPLRDAMLNLTERVPLFDVKFFVMSVLLQRDTGGNLAEILDKLSYLVRERFKILRQVRVYTAQGRLTMVILMALPFVLAAIMSFIAPQLMRLMVTDSLGQALTVTGVVMETIGFFLIRKVIQIKV